MHVAITGASGLVGRALTAALAAQGHRVTPLVRRTARTGEIAWDPTTGRIDAAVLDGVEAVVHLAGENVGAGRWTKARRARIRESRLRGTDLLSRTLASLARPPRVLVSASAIGIYGDRGDELLTETSSPAPAGDFFGDLVRAWETATEPAAHAGIRVALPRFGVILSSEGGALAKMLPAFRLGIAGPLGNGRQWMSWISIADAVGAIQHALATEALAGPFNAVAPTPVTNRSFTETLGRVLGRPTAIPVPAVALRTLFGEMANATLLASTRVVPERLQAAGYRFEHPTLEAALRAVLRRPV